MAVSARVLVAVALLALRGLQAEAGVNWASLRGQDAGPCAREIGAALCEGDACAGPLLLLGNSSLRGGGGGGAVPLCLGGACERAYEHCRALRFEGNPFAPKDRAAADLYPTLPDFAAAFCRERERERAAPGEGEASCYDGPERAEEEEAAQPRRKLEEVSKVCVERISSTVYITMAGHPSNSSFAVAATQAGLLQLVVVPPPRSRQALRVQGTFLNLTARVWYSGERGLLGVAFHPQYQTNGRFFVSYICNSDRTPDCKSPCACNAATGCTVGQNGTSCNGVTIVAEYVVTNPSDVNSVPSATEKQRFLAFGRPYSNHNGGDIFFGNDGYLYYTSGDGGKAGDPFTFAQNGMAMLGKILRLDVDSKSGGKNYAIPPSNPFPNTPGVLPEIFALGLRNPWRCAVDPVTGLIFCGDVGQALVEEIDIISSGGNYGWNRMEGTTLYKAATATTFGTLQGPLFEYAHFGVNIEGIPVGGICVIGGVVYRAYRNSCIKGKYLYSDLTGATWIATVYPPAGSAPSTAAAALACASYSPLPCSTGSFGSVMSWNTDALHEAYMLTSSGLFRVADFWRCNLAC